jgi:hypothetical protein
MRNWAWLLPCWVWKYFFAQLPKQRVLLDGRTRFVIRLDEEFALVYDPERKQRCLNDIQENQNTPAPGPARVFVASKKRALSSAGTGRSKFPRTCGLRDCLAVGTGDE